MPGFLEYNLGADLTRAEILALSDVHVGDPLFVEKEFLRLIEWVLEAENRFVILNGDLANIATKTSKSNVYTSRLTPDEEIDYISSHLQPLATARRILVSTSGNHENRTTKDCAIDPAYRIAKSLDVPYFRESAVVYLRLGRSARRTGRHDAQPVPYLIYVTHGTGGGGRRLGSAVNRVEEITLNVEAVDVIVVGHTHRPWGAKSISLVPDVRNKKLVEHEICYANAGAFMRWGGYAEFAQFRPGSRAMPVFELDGVEKHVTVRL